MIILVSNRGKIPDELKTFQVETWSVEEFIDRATTEPGIDTDEGIWYDVGCLTSDIYEALSEYSKSGESIVYYRFEDTPMPTDFTITDDVKIIGEKKEEIPAKEIEEPTPTMENPTTESSVMETQVLSQMSPEQMQVPPQQPNNQPNNAYGTQQQINQTGSGQLYGGGEQPQMQQQMGSGQLYGPQQPIPQQQMGSGQLYGSQQPMSQNPQNPYPQQQMGTGQLYGEQYPNQSNQPNIPNQTPTEPQHSNNGIVQGGALNTQRNLDINLSHMLKYDDYDSSKPGENRKASPAKIILFGSSKGGTGKTFTCLASAYWYAKMHPTQRVALADFDIIDGQIGITLTKLTPTMLDFYQLYKGGYKDFEHLNNIRVKSDKFSPNIDFYLAPSQDIPEVTNDNEFWFDVFRLLITNYDVVFFDSGIDYIGKAPISKLYNIADKIIITCNPSINSVKSVIKQFKTLSGQRQNNVFKPADNILEKVNVVLTRVYDDDEINDIVIKTIIPFAPVIIKFGNIDDMISQIQWYQRWYLIDESKDITDALEIITNMEET